LHRVQINVTKLNMFINVYKGYAYLFVLGVLEFCKGVQINER
jgi:hypothetical protein